jgi:hypothetical protein
MELNRLAAKQKRIQSLNALIEEYHAPANLREEAARLSRDYATVLERSATSGGVSEPDIAAIRDIERQFDTLSEQLRLLTNRY